MSASLVGSEMCIRDSPAGPTGRNVLVQGLETAENKNRGPSVAALGAGGACLLYTSDAADDM
eukprot:13280491-Alexandrium_andersonii.AAC.1